MVRDLVLWVVYVVLFFALGVEAYLAGYVTLNFAFGFIIGFGLCFSLLSIAYEKLVKNMTHLITLDGEIIEKLMNSGFVGDEVEA